MKPFAKQRTWPKIGSGISSTNTVCYEYLDQNTFLICMGGDIPGYAQNVLDYETCLAQSTSQFCINYYASTNGQSDSFIKSPSQAAFDAPWANNAVRVEAFGVNHLEMKKHPNMAVIYRNAFENVYGPAFATPRR